jgi:hypothetical protein
MFYHYAFMAISLALFGMSMGAVLVYIKPHWFKQERLPSTLAILSLLMAVSVAVSFYLYLLIPFTAQISLWGLLSTAVTFILIAIPFVFSGIVVTLVLTRYPGRAGRLYAFDLVGAAVGTVLMVLLTTPLTGFGVVLFVGVLSGLAGVAFAWRNNRRRLLYNVVFSGIMLILAVSQPYTRLYYPSYVKSRELLVKPLIEKWNHHSTVAVVPVQPHILFSWGMSSVAPRFKEAPEQLFIYIDAAALTVITRFDGDLSKLQYMAYDVTALANFLRPRSKILVIGSGGGRDLLTGLLFQAREIIGVEINGQILDLLNEDLGSFTGRLGSHPRIRFVNDEARSFIERSGETFDIIQASMIDSWAATSAGAFVLTENSLYTVEGWQEFFRHLNKRGVVSMSRWWFPDQPAEMLRLVSVAREALIGLGITDVSRHLLVAANINQESVRDGFSMGVGTLLASASPFSDQDVEKFEMVCREMQFDVLYSAGSPGHEAFGQLIDPQTSEGFIAGYPLNIAPPTDDSPYFFNQLSFIQTLLGRYATQWTKLKNNFNLKAMATLVTLFFLVLVLSVLGLLLPLLWDRRQRRKRGEKTVNSGELVPHTVFFAAIGLGFILMEMGQIQRFNIFLGHPVYSLVVVLFSLLLCTGIGSYLTERFLLSRSDWRSRGWLALGILAAVALLAALFTPQLLHALHGVSMIPRILLAIFVMSAMGLWMGCAFPLGLKAASTKVPRETAWLWAINGALSVVGSVLAVATSIEYGISFTCLVGAVSYVAAFAVFRLTSKAA